MPEPVKRPSKRGVILPPEHGSWGMIAEPVLLGLLIEFSWEGLAIAMLSFCLFLLRVPLLRLWKGRRMPHPDPHADLVKKFTAIISAIALACFTFAGLSQPGWAWVLPFLLALPFALPALFLQNRGKTRHLLPELLAAVAIAAPVSAILIAGEYPMGPAYALWFLIALKSASCIFFVRSQIRRFHQRPAGRSEMLLLHVCLIFPLGLLIWWELLPFAVLWAYPLLLGRAMLLSSTQVKSAKRVGWIEVGISLLFVGICAVGLG
jgi:hypothetical protein